MAVTEQPVVKKKQVRFARIEEDDDNEDQDEDTLFDKRKDTRGGLRSAVKVGKRSNEDSDKVEIISRGRSSRDPGVCHRWLISLSLCASFLGLGMSISVLGPTFEDLAINVNRNISNISYIFVGRSMGYMGGSVVAGILFDCLNPHLLLGFSLLVTAFGMFATPFCKKALLLTALMSSVGISMGFLDTGGNVLILKTWGEQSGPHMQALHFSFAAGAFVSPIIAKLLFGHSDALSPNSSAGQVSKPLEAVPQFSPSRSISTLQSMWAYVVIAAFIMLTSLLFFILYSRSGPSQDKAKTQSRALVAKHHTALICLLSIFFFWYVGAEVAYGSFIFTYAKDFVGMDQWQAAGLNSLFWGAFAAARGSAIFFATCMYPGTMILLSLVGCTLSSLLLSLFSKELPAIWSCTALYGISMATTFPCGISWLEQYTTITGRSAAAFVVGAAVGEMLLPALVGFLLGRLHEQPVLMYLALLTSTMTSILFPVMYKLASSPAGAAAKPRGRARPDSDDSEFRQALLDSGENDDDDGDDEEEQQEEEEGPDQWNDADFEVIEMDDASFNSPNKAPPQTSVPGAVANPFTPAAKASPAQPSVETRLVSLTDPPSSLLTESPRRKLLLGLDREKED